MNVTPGSHVRYFDDKGTNHHALVTAVNGSAVSLVTVIDGEQVTRVAVPHREQIMVHDAGPTNVRNKRGAGLESPPQRRRQSGVEFWVE